MKKSVPIILGLGAVVVALAGCNRPTPAGDAAAAAGAPAGAAAPVAEGKAEDLPPSGPLPERKTPITATAFEPAVIGNVYRTDFQDMILDRWDEAGAAGRYASGSGRFEGVREKGSDGPDGIDTIRGYWIQPTSEHRCDTERGGSHYWGQIQFNFVRDRKSFIGFWSFCDATPLDRWNGQFVRRDPAIAAEVEAQLAASSTPATSE